MQVMNILKSIFKFEGKTKLNIVLDFCFLFFLFITLVTIPVFSFKTRYTSITWIFTVLTLLVIGIELLLYYSIRIDFISVSLFLFLISALISCALNGFKNFIFTPLLLNMVTLILYLYFQSNKSIVKPAIIVSYIALSVFVIIYLVLYGKEVLTFNNERLGTKFGDQNDIALFLGLCLVISFFLLLKSNIIVKIFAALIAILSFLCGVSTGSKIFIFSVVVAIIAVIIVTFGKKRWYISLLIIAGLSIASIVLFSLPFMENLRNRLLIFFNSFFDIGYHSTIGIDASSFDRYHLLKASFQLFLKKPLFGFGVNGFQNSNGFYDGWSHNNLGEYLSDFGLIGTLLFNFPIILSVVSFFKNRDKRDNYSKLSFIIIVFFISAMISVAYTREKIYCFIIPISFASLFKEKPFIDFSFKKTLVDRIVNRRNAITHE